MLTTTSFVPLAKMQMRALGDESLELVIVSHPIGGIGGEALEARYAEAIPQGESWLQAAIDRRGIA
jgi:hypothetical protein